VVARNNPKNRCVKDQGELGSVWLRVPAGRREDWAVSLGSGKIKIAGAHCQIVCVFLKS
jgi:hypothetical protein